MIRLELSTAVAIYTFVTVIGLLIIWILFGEEGNITQYTTEKKDIWQCSICTHTYVDSLHTVISKCPQCGSFNKKPLASARDNLPGGK